MSTLHVVEPGCEVRKVGGRLVVVRGKDTLATVRLFETDAVHVHGGVQMTTQALLACADRGARVLFHKAGRVVLVVEPPEASNVATRIAQVDRLRDGPFRVAFVRALLAEKVRTARNVVERWRGPARAELRAALTEALGTLDGSAERLAAVEEPPAEASLETVSARIDAMRGMEGTASAASFSALGALLEGAHGFAGRQRRPPKDPVNALLSFGYVLLASELEGRLLATGLDTGIGMLHGLRSGRESLALDAMEPYRAPIVDVLVARLIARNELKASDFEPHEDGAVLLTRDGCRTFIRRWESYLDAPHRGEGLFGGTPPSDWPRDSWRDALRAQTIAIRRAIIHRTLPEWYTDREAGDAAGIQVGKPYVRASGRRKGGKGTAGGEAKGSAESDEPDEFDEGDAK